MAMLAGLCVNLTQTKTCLGKDRSLENDSIRPACGQVCGVVSWLMMVVGAPS